MAPDVRRYAVEIVSATRQVPEIRLGASPRATLHLVRAARAQAALSGRDYVVPDDLHTIAGPVLAHRLVLTTEAHAARRSATDVVRAVLHRVPVPQGSGPRQ
jgi:MoxR-like ATPase